jgi:hypothetical protein
MSEQMGFERPMERRDQHRQPCRAGVRVFTSDLGSEWNAADSFILESANLSDTGVFLQTDLLFPVGEWLDLELDVPGRPRPVRGRGQVVRVDPRLEPPGPGIAVRLRDLRTEDQTALRRLGAAAWRVVL